MINYIKKLNTQITFNQIVIFIFTIIYCGFYYPNYQLFINISYIILLIGVIKNLLHKKNNYKNEFWSLVCLFVIYSLLSSLWAMNYTASYNASVQLIKSSLIAVLFSLLITDKKNFITALISLAIGGLIYSLIYIENVNVADLSDTRIVTEEGSNSMLPNVNVVAMILSFSFLFFIHKLFVHKKKLYIIPTIISFIIIFILGSRKSIISIFLGLLILFYQVNKKTKIKICFLLLALIAGLTLFIPDEYLNFVFDRLAQLNIFSNQKALLDSSDEMRIMLFENGLNFISDKPFFGFGFYSFSILFEQLYNIRVYSHNNFIETLVGGGIIGFILYYGIYIIIMRNLVKYGQQNDYKLLLWIYIFILLFNHIGIVVLLDRFTWLLLSILYSGSKLLKNNYYENRISCRQN